ncbi:MAG: hypothetical protein KI786_02675, partial [Mameliella sp.]|nr:hypothetical protein [Phaeodactylibacter sp.]
MNRILQSMNLKNYLLLPLLFSVLGLQAQQACLDFEEFPGGPIFGPLLGNVPGDTLFEQDGLIAVAQELVYLNGNSGFETAWIEGEVLQWMDDQFLFMGNNALELIYTEGVQEICFDFFDGGGEENFSVNGSDLIVIADIKDIEG